MVSYSHGDNDEKHNVLYYTRKTGTGLTMKSVKTSNRSPLYSQAEQVCPVSETAKMLLI